MDKRRSRSILSTLFIPFTALFVVAFILTSGFFVAGETIRIHENSFLTIENDLNNISDGLDKMVDELNTVSQNAAYSNLIKEHFASYLGYSMEDAGSSSEDFYSNYQNTRVLYDLLVAIMGPNTPVDQIYLYGLSGGSFGVGRDNATTFKNAADFPWYSSVNETHGEKYIYTDTDERLAPYYSYSDNRFLCLCRKYYNSLNIPQGFIEVKKSMTPLMRSIDSYNRPYKEEFFILDQEGNAVYPLSDGDPEDERSAEYYAIINDSTIEAERVGSAFIKKSGASYVLYHIPSKCDFISVAVVQRKNLHPIYRYTVFMIMLLAVISIAITVLSYRISHRISKPLGEMYSRLYSFGKDLDHIAEQELPEVETSVIELNGLYQAFLKMQEQTRQSMQRQIELQNQEIQSRMLALQAQMNPHFLYNSLSAIQAMADEGMTDEIYLLCQNMSDILRYISSDSNQLVSLNDELSHTLSYIECMKVRYAGQLSCLVDIPEDMGDVQIPKLCLQLLVENAIKFMTKKRPPWHIEIDGSREKDSWEIHIKDNGPGFSDEVLKELEDKIREIDESGVLPNLEINGMGLMNIYIRFKLLYAGRHVFRIANNETEGALITIGGAVQ